MTTVDATIFHTVGGLVLGFGAWGLAGLAIGIKKPFVSQLCSFSSFCFCALSLLLQIFEINNRAAADDFSAIADTIRAVSLAACVLIGVTVLLNAVAIMKTHRN